MMAATRYWATRHETYGPGWVEHYLDSYQAPHRLQLADHLAPLIWSNAVELGCTAGLPAVYTRILTLRELPAWEYVAYLGLYNLAYVADDALMVAIAVATLSRRRLQERGGRWLQLASGAVMVALGLLLWIAPGWLR